MICICYDTKTLNLFKGKVVTVFTHNSRMMDQEVTDIFLHVLQLGIRQRLVISYHTQASLLSVKGNQSCKRCDLFLDTVNCLRLKTHHASVNESVSIWRRQTENQLGRGEALSLCHWDQWQKPALSNWSSKLGTPYPFEDGDRSILQTVIGLLAPSDEQC
jgi:hypothetical protein